MDQLAQWKGVDIISGLRYEACQNSSVDIECDLLLGHRTLVILMRYCKLLFPNTYSFNTLTSNPDTGRFYFDGMRIIEVMRDHYIAVTPRGEHNV